MRALIVPILFGGVAGGLATLIVWQVANKALDRRFANAGQEMLERGEAQMRTRIDRQLRETIPPLIRTQMEATLRGYGLTPETGQRISRALAVADRMGFI